MKCWKSRIMQKISYQLSCKFLAWSTCCQSVVWLHQIHLSSVQTVHDFVFFFTLLNSMLSLICLVKGALLVWLCIPLHSSDSSIVMQCMPPSFTPPTRCKINSVKWSVPVLRIDWFLCKFSLFLPHNLVLSLCLSRWAAVVTILHQ